jgi:hypothetical protein
MRREIHLERPRRPDFERASTWRRCVVVFINQTVAVTQRTFCPSCSGKDSIDMKSIREKPRNSANFSIRFGTTFACSFRDQKEVWLQCRKTAHNVVRFAKAEFIH